MVKRIRHVRFRTTRRRYRKRGLTGSRTARVAKRRRIAGKKHYAQTIAGVLTPRKYCECPFYDCVYASLPNATTTFQVPAATIYRCNSVYDPKNAATGTWNYAATGYKYMSSLYNHYCVISSDIIVTIRQVKPLLTGVYTDVVFALFIDDNTTTTNNLWTDVMPLTREKNAVVRTLHMTQDSSASIKMRLKWRPKRQFASTMAITNDSQLSALVGSNPTEAQYFCLGTQWADGVGGRRIAIILLVFAFVIK